MGRAHKAATAGRATEPRPPVAPEERQNPLGSGSAGFVPPGGAGGQEQPRAKPQSGARRLAEEERTDARRVGEQALFTIDLTNLGTTDVRGVRVIDRYDPALSPDSATGGYRLDGDAITWTIDVPPGRPTRLSVRCSCQTAAARTCNRVLVILPDGNRIEDESCLEILRPSARRRPRRRPCCRCHRRSAI